MPIQMEVGKNPFMPSRMRKHDASDRTHFTWSSESSTEYDLIGYTIQSFLKRNASHWMVLAEQRSGSISYGAGGQDVLLQTGAATFVLDGQLCAYQASYENDAHKVFSDQPIEGIIEQIQRVLQRENPARDYYLQFHGNHTLYFNARPAPATVLADVILPPKMLEDIVDNTIGHLEHVQGPNGLIFYGAPGTGKSHAAQAIVGEAMRRGYCAGYAAGRIDFEDLDEMVAKYFTPGVLVLEDIDTFTENRDDCQQVGFSDFLQFMSGLHERKQKTVVIATTNHLKFLDDAVAKRPVRFNRRYEFKVPDRVAMSQLFGQFFPDIEINSALVESCLQNKMTGSHLAEVHRTCQILGTKNNKPKAEVLEEAVAIVGGEFMAQSSNCGF